METQESKFNFVNRKASEIMHALAKAPMFKKWDQVRARPAVIGEEITTTLEGGTKETINKACEGDWIITNPGGEQYIISEEKFFARYETTDEAGVYVAKGYCRAIQNPFGKPIEIMASWGSPQTGGADCMIADTCDKGGKCDGEPCLIDADAFAKTYKQVKAQSQATSFTSHNIKRLLIFGGAVILMALIVGGMYLYKNNNTNPPINAQSHNQVQQDHEDTISDTHLTNSAITCGDFSELSHYISEIIQLPDSRSVLQMDPYTDTNFRWQRNSSEPFITYPIIYGVQSIYGDQNNFRSNDFITSAIENDSQLIDQSIDGKAKELGFTVNSLNTLPLKTFSNKDTLQVFAFTKGESIYEIVLKSEWGDQAPGQSTVTVTCGKTLSSYDEIYDALHLKISTSVENRYNDDYVSVFDVSADEEVYALTGSPNQIGIAEYYHFDGASLKLISENSYPTECAPLELQKVGKGMRCVGQNNTHRTVHY